MTVAARRPALLFERLGPYHVARLKAVAETTEAVLAVEVCARDETYGWEEQREPLPFARVTLFESAAGARRVPQLARRLSAALDAFAPDCVLAPGWSHPAALVALRWARRRGVRAVIMSDSQEADAPRSRLGEAVKRAVVACASGALVAGRTHAGYMSRLGMPAERIATGYDVVDNAHFAAGAAVARAAPGLRQRLGLPERYFLAVARFVEKKNLRTLIEAHARYRRAVAEPWDLVLVGDGPLRPTLQAMAGEGVTLRPFAAYDELPPLYALAGAFVLCSTSEQWGLVVNEAMAAGCPVIASDRAGATAELVEDGVTGLVTAPDVASLEAALHRMAVADRSGLAAAARERIADFTPARFAAGVQAAAAHPPRRGPAAPLAGAVLTALAWRGAVPALAARPRPVPA